MADLITTARSAHGPRPADAVPLFDLPPAPPAAPPAEQLSPDRRRTIRQAGLLAGGWHPLGGVYEHARLHPAAAPHDDRAAPGRRCGNCRYRRVTQHHHRTYAKCAHGEIEHGSWPRASAGPATDVRAWWPACTDHEWGDPKLGPDAARWVPELAEEVSGG